MSGFHDSLSLSDSRVLLHLLHWSHPDHSERCPSEDEDCKDRKKREPTHLVKVRFLLLKLRDSPNSPENKKELKFVLQIRISTHGDKNKGKFPVTFRFYVLHISNYIKVERNRFSLFYKNFIVSAKSYILL